MKSRTRARQRAVEAMFEAEQRDVDVTEILSRNPDANEYATELGQLAQIHRVRIDEVLDTYASDWNTGRMPAVDRAILRCAVAELLWKPEIDTAVAISEAVELAEILSTDESGKFINGILGTIGHMRESLASF